MQAAKCGFDLNKNILADSLDFERNLKTNPTSTIQNINQNFRVFQKLN